MPSHSFFNDKHIHFSATMAAAIGLDEAILLTVLNAAGSLQSQPWARFHREVLRQQLPFWNDAHIRQVLQSLIAKGLININGALFPDTENLFFNFGAAPATAPKAAPVRTTPAITTPMLENWQPAAETLQRLAQHGVENSFALAQLDAFILQAKEQGKNQNDWNARFFRYVRSQWVYAQNDTHRERTNFHPSSQEATPMHSQWRPSQDAITILERDGVASEFIIDTIPEFILYWCENGQAHKTWSSKFVQHVRLQWQRFIATEAHATKPMPINEDWRPNEDCFDILALAYIDRAFAEQLVPEFVLYWRDTKQAHTSWNSRFLQYAKQQWGKRLTTGNAHGSTTAEPSYTTAEASRQRLADTSW